MSEGTKTRDEWLREMGLDASDTLDIPEKKPEEYPFDKHCFAYPSMVAKNQIYAEDIQQAVIDLLEKSGVGTQDDLSQMYFEFEDPDTGRWITTQVLKIRWR